MFVRSFVRRNKWNCMLEVFKDKVSQIEKELTRRDETTQDERSGTKGKMEEGNMLLMLQEDTRVFLYVEE